MARRYAGLGATLPLQLTIDTPYQRVGATGHFRIVGAKPGAKVYWTSFKDGKYTGELRSTYDGHVVGDNGTLDLEVTWDGSQTGDWTKQAEIIAEDGSSDVGQVSFRVQEAPPTAPTTPGAYPQQPGFFDSSTNLFGFDLPTWLVAGGGLFLAWKFLGGKH